MKGRTNRLNELIIQLGKHFNSLKRLLQSTYQWVYYLFILVFST